MAVNWMGPLGELRREMDRLLDNFGTGAGRWPLQSGTPYPALNVWDGGDALFVEAEVPGIPRENLEILTIGNELTIKGRRPPLGDERATYHRRERGTGEFTRLLQLPAEVNAEGVEASLEGGVLTIRLPKAEAAKPRKIQVKSL